MKDATAELSTTVIAIVAIAAILAVFTVFLLPTLRAQIALSQACTSGPDVTINGKDGSVVKCGGPEGADKDTWTCEYTPADAQEATNTKKCTK